MQLKIYKERYARKQIDVEEIKKSIRRMAYLIPRVHWKKSPQSIYYCGQASSQLKEKRELSAIRRETFRAQRRAPETRILSIALRVLRDTLPQFGINSRHRVYFGDRQSFERSVSGTRRNRSRHYRFQGKQTESRLVRYEMPSLFPTSTIRRRGRSARLTGREIDRSRIYIYERHGPAASLFGIFIGRFLNIIRYQEHIRIIENSTEFKLLAIRSLNFDVQTRRSKIRIQPWRPKGANKIIGNCGILN